VSLNKSATWNWKNWQISWSLSKESTSEKDIKKTEKENNLNKRKEMKKLSLQ